MLSRLRRCERMMVKEQQWRFYGCGKGGDGGRRGGKMCRLVAISTSVTRGAESWSVADVW